MRKRRAWPHFSLFRLAFVILALVIVLIASPFVYAVYQERRSHDILGTADYPAVREAMLSRM